MHMKDVCRAGAINTKSLQSVYVGSESTSLAKRRSGDGNYGRLNTLIPLLPVSEDIVLRGRLEHSSYSVRMRQSAVIPREHHIAKLMVSDVQLQRPPWSRVGLVGLDRRGTSITRIRKLRIARNCLIRKSRFAPLGSQLIIDLPVLRLKRCPPHPEVICHWHFRRRD